MDADKLAKLRAIADDEAALPLPFGGYDEYRTTFNPSVVKALLDVVEAAARLADISDDLASGGLGPDTTYFRTALAALAKTFK